MVSLTVDSPLGPLGLDLDDDGALVRLALLGSTATVPEGRRGGVTEVEAVLDRYFTGDVAAIDGLEVRPSGTEFQRAVWAALREIPVGETRSYADLAASVGRPGAVRAVGQANGANPVALVVPCHRVIRSDGSLGGYAFGLPAKQWLLAHERTHTGSSVDAQLRLA